METLAQLIKRIEELEQKYKSFEASTTISFEVGGAIKERVLSGTVSPSAVTAASKTITIPAVGDAATPMNGFIVLNLNGVTYNIPYYNA